MRVLIFFLISITFITILFTEFYLRSKGLGDPIRYDSSILYGYAPKENQVKIRKKNIKVSINDVGLRSLNNWKNNSKKKIVFFGDSVTYGGSYIDDNDTFAEIICKNLTDYLCGNAGVNSYSIFNIVMRSKYDDRLKHSDIIIYLFPPDDFFREYADSNKALFYLNKKEFILPSITEALNFIAKKYDINNFISKHNDTISDENENYKLIDYSVKILKDEINTKKSKEKKVYVFLTNRKNDKQLKNKRNKYIKNLLLKEIDEAVFLGNVLNKDEYFYDEGVHLSKKGHSILGDAISKYIIKDKLN